jgi:ribulose-phosphate 3-epimerase
MEEHTTYNKIEFIPAVLTTDFLKISELVLRTGKASKWIQIDICDGVFVSTETWPYVRKVLPVFNDDFELPSWDTMNYEADLMIANPSQHIDNLKNIGFSRAVIHIGSESVANLLIAATKLTSYDIEVGVGISVHSEQSEAIEFLKSLVDTNIPHYIQIMGIENLGVQGQPFSDQCTKLVDTYKSLYPNTVIQIDGAVNESNIKELYDAGADSFVLGSYLSGYGSVSDKIQTLKNLLY